MNLPTDRDTPDIPAREWQAQEDALRAERLGLADGDPRLDDDRRVARALRQPLPDPLPADFAQVVARRAGRRQRPREWPERLLGPALLVTMVTVGAVYGFDTFASGWKALMAQVPVHQLTSPWLISLAASLGLTVVLDKAWPGRRARP